MKLDYIVRTEQRQTGFGTSEKRVVQIVTDKGVVVDNIEQDSAALSSDGKTVSFTIEIAPPTGT